jgi:hypothetical protein
VALWELCHPRLGRLGLRAHRTKTTLLKMTRRVRPHPACRQRAHRRGVGPTSRRRASLPRRALIDGGAYRDCLVSPRSAVEYGVPTNGASAAESPVSIEVGAGRVPLDQVLRELGTGIFVSNLWYLNFSDRSACRATGMTRFATFWVEQGVIQAPLNVMRFDEALYRISGTHRADGRARDDPRSGYVRPTLFGQRTSARSPRRPFTFTLRPEVSREEREAAKGDEFTTPCL